MGAPIPWQQMIEPVNRMFGNASENVSEPGLRINIAHLGSMAAVSRIREARRRIAPAHFARPPFLPKAARRSNKPPFPAPG
jgi:hypothetical protein